MPLEIVAPDPIRKRNITIQLVTPTRDGGGGSVGTSEEFEIRGGARFLYSFEIPSMLTEDACEIRAWLHAMRGGATYTKLRLPEQSAARTATATLSAGGAIGDSSIAVTSNTGAAVGNFAVIGDIGTPSANVQICRIRIVTGTTIGIEPALRFAYSSGAAVRFGGQYARFRIKGQTPQVPLRPGRSEPVRLEFEEIV